MANHAHIQAKLLFWGPKPPPPPLAPDWLPTLLLRMLGADGDQSFVGHVQETGCLFQQEIDEAVNALAQEHGLEVDVHTELDALADSADGRFVYHAEEGPYSPVLFLAQ